ncbi:hypothetical protein E2C01_016473 [Portunus trituberculatus]|uniref:Uncharacterized protein n=1 Tax=Portunus trituberculatus TaxID=210409 RepID=A0A5B7DR72_PORTR|nr:hypothetical protein [Portunus trituberculatus]
MCTNHKKEIINKKYIEDNVEKVIRKKKLEKLAKKQLRHKEKERLAYKKTMFLVTIVTDILRSNFETLEASRQPSRSYGILVAVTRDALQNVSQVNTTSHCGAPTTAVTSQETA